MNERGGGFQPVDKKNVKELKDFSRDIAKERIRKMEELGAGREDIESIAKEAQKIEEEIGKSADTLVKDETFLGWVRKTFKEAVLIVAFLKTMASMSGSGHEAEPQAGNHVAAEIQDGDVGTAGMDSANDYHSGSDFTNNTDTYQDNIDRNYSPDYHVGEGQLDLSGETQQINKMIQSFCEQRGIQPWEVGASIHLTSHASIEGDANSNYDLAGEGLSIAEESFGKSLSDLGINADNLKITSENIGEAAYVGGKILNESEARTAMMDLLGVNGTKLDQKIHAFNHGGNLPDAEKKILGDYLDRGIEVRVVLEVLSNPTNTGFTEQISVDNVRTIPADSGHETVKDSEPFIPVEIARPEDRRQTTEEVYSPSKKKKWYDRIFKQSSDSPIIDVVKDYKPVIKTDNEVVPEEAKNNKTKEELTIFIPIKRAAETGSSQSTIKESGDNDDAADNDDTAFSPTIKPRLRPYYRPTPDTSPITIIPKQDSDPDIRPGLVPVGKRSEKVTTNSNVRGNMQQNPNVQGTGRQGSEGVVFKKGNNKEIEEWDRVINKGDRLKTRKQMVKLGRKGSEKARSLDRKVERSFAKSIGESGSYEE